MNKRVLTESRMLISGFLKNRRIELGITQEQLADKSGMGIATIKRFESGRFWLNLKQYLILCHHLKCCPIVEAVESDSELAKLMRERWSRRNQSN